MADPSTIVQRVKGAIRLAGEGAWLVGYDINGIQELVTASNRPIAMRGASKAIAGFDQQVSSGALSVFAGGGRGIELAPSADDARKRVDDLVRTFREATHSGVLAAEAVPFRRDLPAASLAWLRRKLENAKDAASRPGGRLPADREGECVDCNALHADADLEVKGEIRRVCARCSLLIATARDAGGASHSLTEFARNRRLAAISADGNNLGPFFASLGSLEETAVASEAVSDIFRAAHEEAKRRLGSLKVLAPVTGGDDIRVFLAPEGVLTYVEALVRGVESGAAAAGDLGGVLSRAAAAAFARMGVGVGAVVAGDHYPAARLMVQAHALEVSAKTICRAADGARSAFDFAILTSGEARLGPERSQALSLDETSWKAALRTASALRKVPSAQRAVLAERRSLASDEEFENLFLYQVARWKKWQAWFDACGVDWRDRAAIRSQLRGLRVDLLDLLPGEEPTV